MGGPCHEGVLETQLDEQQDNEDETFAGSEPCERGGEAGNSSGKPEE